MKKIGLIIAAALAILVSALPVLASDPTTADNVGIVRIAENGTSISSIISVPFSLNTTALIAQGWLNDNCTDSTILTNAGSDTAYMPASSNSSDWIVYVPTIGKSSDIDFVLYTGGGDDMNGDIRYFPDDAGMTATDDDADFELGDNFTIEQRGYIDTANGTDKYLVQKAGAITVFVSANVSGNITAELAGYGGTSGNVTPTFGSGAGWSGSTSVYDDNTGTAALYNGVPATSWTGFFTAYHSAIYCEQVRFWAHREVGYIQTIDIDVSTDNLSWTDVYEGDFTDVTWQNKALPSGMVIAYARVRFYNQAGGATNVSFYEFDFVEQASPAKTVSIVGIASGEHTIAITANSTDLWLSVDGVLSSTVSVGVGVINTSDNWTFLLKGVMPYMEYQYVWIDGILTQNITWQYGTTFQDATAYNNDATPTFRTTSSHANVSASLISFEPVTEAEADSWDVVQPDDMISTTNITDLAGGTSTGFRSGGLYDELEYGNLPGAEFANTMLDAGGVPRGFYWFFLAFIFVDIIAILVYRLTTSLLIQYIIMLVTICVLGITIIPLWTAIIFGLNGLAILISAHQNGWS